MSGLPPDAPPPAMKDPGIAVVEMYVEAANLGHRLDYLRLPAGTPTDTEIQLGAVAQVLDDDHAVLRMRAWANTAVEKPPVYDFDVTVGVLVKRIKGEENMSLREFINSSAAVSIVFPYLRAAVGDITGRGRFGPVWLSLVNPQNMRMLEITPELVAATQKMVEQASTNTKPEAQEQQP